MRQQPNLVALQRAVADPSGATTEEMLGLQRGYGNEAVASLVQPKLTVGAVGDQYEQEADRISEQVMNMPPARETPSPAGGQRSSGDGQHHVLRQVEEEELQAKPLAASITPLVQRQEEEELQMTPLVQRQEEEELQMTPLVQRQEEEELQMTPLVQRQEEEELQMMPLVQRQEEEELQMMPQLQRQEEEELQMTPQLQRQEEEELQMMPLVQRQEEEELQMMPAAFNGQLTLQRSADGGFQAGRSLERRLDSNRGQGTPLSAEVRTFMEPRFGTDFSGVQVHTGTEAVQMNRELQSQAFTRGRDIYFNTGRYNPSSEGGKQLLAHELTHVVQQSGSNDRIARWGGAFGGTSHINVTDTAFATLERGVKRWYSDEAQEYLAHRAEDMDLRAGFLLGSWFAGQLYGKGQKAGKGIGRAGRAIGRGIGRAGRGVGRGIGRALGWMTRGKVGLTAGDKEWAGMMEDVKGMQSDIAEKQRIADNYDNIKWYWRSPSEAPNHGEGGMYKGDGSAVDEARVSQYLQNAVKAWRQNNRRQALSILGLALHSAEDRGAHGDGKPGTGHDPRKTVEPPPLAKTQYYDYGNPDDGHACDRRAQNEEGYDFAVGLAQEVLARFVHGIGISGGKQLTEEDLEKGAKLKGFEKPSKFKRFLRRVGIGFGKDIIRL